MYNIVDKIFDDFEFRAPRRYSTNNYEAYVDDNVLNLNIDFAGRKKEDFDICLEDNAINIKVNGDYEENKDVEWIIRKTRKSCTYSYDLPFDIDQSKISASYEDGVLKIKAPRKQENIPKKIEIK